MAAGYVEGFVNFAKNQTVQRKRELGRERTRRYRRRRERQTVKDSLPEKRYKTPI
jgi:hypothetical protein